MSSKLKNSDGTDYKGARAVKALWRANRKGGESLKVWAAAQPKDSDVGTWLANKRDK